MTAWLLPLPALSVPAVFLILWIGAALSWTLAEGLAWTLAASWVALIVRGEIRRARMLRQVRRDLDGGVARLETQQTAAGRWCVRVAPLSAVQLGRELVEPNPDGPHAAQQLALDEIIGPDEENRRGRLSRRQQRELAVAAIPTLLLTALWVGVLAFGLQRLGLSLQAALLLPFVAAALWSIQTARELLADALGGRVAFVEGALVKQREHRPRGAVAYFVQVGGVRVLIAPKVNEALQLTDVKFRLGYSPRSKRLITLQPSESALPVGGTP